MKLRLHVAEPLDIRTACLIVGAYADHATNPIFEEIDRRLAGRLKKARRSGEFTGKSNETLLLQPTGSFPAQRILLVGLGPYRQAGSEQLRQAAGTAASALLGMRLPDLVCALPLLDLLHSTPATRIAAVAEGLQLGSYQFNRYRSTEDNPKSAPRAGTLLIPHKSDRLAAAAALTQAEIVTEAVFLARNLVNEPGNVKSPAFLAEQAAEIAAECGLLCTILDRTDLEKQGCGALLGVAQGSIREPYLIVLQHQGAAVNEPPIALVGKGVVFDAGGISLKPAEKMDEMKMDMAGGATVIATCSAAARLKLPVNLVGVIPAVENLPSGSAIRPGDILTSLSGQTIEVINTDAEGRLILADALTFVRQFQPRLVIDVATLTGACIIALGHHATAVLGNHPPLIQALRRAGEHSGERLWELPLWNEYDQQIKSEVADVKNTGGRPAGTITAAAFLHRFAKEFKWAHLDIAGTAWVEQPRPCHPKGATGVGVRLLTEFLCAATRQK